MKEFRCFIVDSNDHLKPYSCNEIHKNDMSEYFMQFGLFIIFVLFFILIRPISIYCVKKFICLKRDNTIADDIIPFTENKEVQCDIDMNIHRIIINPDTSLNLTEEAM